MAAKAPALSASSALGPDLAARLRAGSTLFKIASSGKPSRKHVWVDEAGCLRWDPSRRKEGSFLSLDNVAAVVPAVNSFRMARYGEPSAHAAVDALIAERRAFGFSAEAMSGWLFKLGGAHGGRKNIRRRWFVLLGTSLFYFAKPDDALCKKGKPIDLSGAVVSTATDDGGGATGSAGSSSPSPSVAGADDTSFTLTWGSSQPDRLLRAGSRDERDRWLAALKRTLRLDICRGGKRPTGMGGGLAGAAGGVSGKRNTALLAPAPAAAPGDAPDADASGGASGPPGSAGLDEGVRAAKATVDGVLRPDHKSLAFQIVCSGEGSGSEGATGKASPVVFICPSLRELDLWTRGLMRAVAAKSRMSAKDRAAAYSEQLSSSASSGGAGSGSAGSDAFIRVCLAEALEESGDAEGALRAYLAAAEAQPRLPSARAGAGRLLLTLRSDAAAAIPLLEAAAALVDQDDGEVMGLLGKARLARGMHKAAASAFTFALGLEPRAPQPVLVQWTLGLAESMAALGRTDDAVTRYKAVLKLEGASPAPASTAAGAGAGGPSRASVPVSARGQGSGQAASPIVRDVHSKLVDLLTAAGREADAATHKAELRRLDLAEVPALQAAAATAMAAGDFRAAVGPLERVADLFPEEPARLLPAALALYLLEGSREIAVANGGPEALASPAASGSGSRTASSRVDGSTGGSATKRGSRHNRGHAGTGGGSGTDTEDGDGDGLASEPESSGEDMDGGSGGSGVIARKSTSGGAAAPQPDPPSLGWARRSLPEKLHAACSSDEALAAVVRAPGAAPLPADSRDCMSLLTKAEELVVSVLTVDPESAEGNLLCGRIYERLATREKAALTAARIAAGLPVSSSSKAPAPAAAAAAPAASAASTKADGAGEDSDGEGSGGGAAAPGEEGASEAAGDAAAAAPSDDPGDDMAASGWTPNQRLQRSEVFYEYVAAAYPGERSAAEAALLHGTLCKRQGRFAEAAAHLQAAVDSLATFASGGGAAAGDAAGGAGAASPPAPAPGRAPDTRADAEFASITSALLARVQRLQRGEPEEPAPAKGKGGDGSGGTGGDMGGIDFEGGASGLLAGVDLSGLSPEERQAAFFKAMLADKQAKEDAKKAAEAAKIASMTPEERAKYDAEQAALAKHEQRKGKVLKSQLGAYAKAAGAAAILSGKAKKKK